MTYIHSRRYDIVIISNTQIKKRLNLNDFENPRKSYVKLRQVAFKCIYCNSAILTHLFPMHPFSTP